eukprot:CAMPEP_0184490754 /NCGR_PEP_ID=MMETSP0113_2-20130426/18732_1 /TAXON_ID=91329 /ORGANISM="Norrisiella sphaerica, Strain BC52" /LENGTH=1237 /DNA_ID=CAMNT_0026874793 /DNA_START=130 /DNA_END=3843 /DNA_ORIENTATION=-
MTTTDSGESKDMQIQDNYKEENELGSSPEGFDLDLNTESEDIKAPQTKLFSEETKMYDVDDDDSSEASLDSNAEGDQVRCRICHSSSGVLYRPCACNGSIAHIHQDCLLQWLSMKNVRECEVCHTTYEFTPIYSADAPGRTNVFDVAHWMVEKALSLYPRMIRCMLVLASWLLLVPLITAWIWKLCFVASLSDLIKLGDFTSDHVWRSLQSGVVICAVVLMVTVVVATFRELMREEHHLAAGQAAAQGEALFPEEDVFFEGEDPALQEAVDDVPFSTWIGFTGPIKYFFVHITSVILYNSVFLVIAVFIPSQVGRILLSSLHIDTDAFARWIFDRIGDALQAGILGDAYTPTPERFAAMYDTFPVKDGALLGCGYLILMAIAMIWGPLSAFFRLNDLPLVGFIYGLLRYVLTGFKFGALVGFELGVFPVYLGWILDLLVLDLVDSTWEARKKFFHDAPLTSVAMHWFLGINFILYVSFVASLLRRTIKRRILSRFLRYPDDPDFQPFHDFIYVPLHKHCKRLCVSGLLYTLLVVLCVHVPAKIFTKLFPSVAPLRWRFMEGSEIPVDLLLFHFAIPAIMGHVDLRGICLEAVKGWFIFISNVLGIDSYLLRDELLRETGEGEQEEIIEEGKWDEGDIGDENDVKLVNMEVDGEDHVGVKKSAMESFPSEGNVEAAFKIEQKFDEEHIDLRDTKHTEETGFRDTKHADDVQNLDAERCRGLGKVNHGADFSRESADKEFTGDNIIDSQMPDGTELKGRSPTKSPSIEKKEESVKNNRDPLDHETISTADVDCQTGKQNKGSAILSPNTGTLSSEVPETKLTHEPSSLGDNDKPAEEKTIGEELEARIEHKDATFPRSTHTEEKSGAATIPRFTLRIFMLILSSWGMHTLVLCACILVPVVLGRLLLRGINTTLARHDLYAVVVGLYAYLGAIIAGSRLARYLQRHDIYEGLALAVKWMFVGLRYVVLSFFVLGVLPLLIGILFDLTIMIPLRTSPDESPRIYPERDWVMGIIFLKVWFQLLVSGIVGDNDVKAAVQQILNEGPENINLFETMRLAVFPYLHKLLMHICLPYALSSGLVPISLKILRRIILSSQEGSVHSIAIWIADIIKILQPDFDLTSSSEDAFRVELWCTSHYFFRFAFLALILSEVTAVFAGFAGECYATLKQSMFEERYLIGKQLRNFGENVGTELEARPKSPESKDALVSDTKSNGDDSRLEINEPTPGVDDQMSYSSLETKT